MASLYDSALNTPSRRLVSVASTGGTIDDTPSRPNVSVTGTNKSYDENVKAPDSGRASKRQKVTRACDSCKTRKRRCEGVLPCSSCWSSGSKCTYNATYTRGRLVAPPVSAHVAENEDAHSPVTAQPGNASCASGAKTNVTEALEGPNSNQRASRAVSPEHEPTTLAGQYTGPSSAYSFLRRAWRRFGLDAHRADEKEPSHPGVPIFNFGDKVIPKNLEALSIFQLPDRATSRELLTTYFDFSMPTYRFLHQPTVSQWLDTYHDQLEDSKESVSLLPARQAVVLMVLGTASLFISEKDSDEPWRESELFFQAAQAKLGTETGKVRLESVQARIAICLYLLHTSRPNQSWYTFGITCQLMMALGMHRDRPKTAPQPDPVTCECRRRAFWAAYTIDFYLSVVLGRPHMIHDDHSDQRFPQALDDEEISAHGSMPDTNLQKDRVIQASVYHAKITRIVKTSIKTQYSLKSQTNEQKLDIASRLNEELLAWKASLPVLLSGAIHPSSLIQIYQRQIVVLRLAYAHAEMLINRPLMLVEPPLDTTLLVTRCLEGAKTTIDTVLQYVSDKRMFSIFWHSQYVTFNALSVIYVWLIQRKRGRMASIKLPFSDDELFQLAETTQDHFAEATKNNASCTRFSIILEELQGEAHRLMARSRTQRPPNLLALLGSPVENHPFARPTKSRPETSASSDMADSMSWESLGADFPLDPDLWLQLDSFPFPDIDFENLGDSL